MRPLVPDRRWFTVAWVDDRVIWQGEELFADAAEQGGVIPAGEV